jgi:quercetin dioxygenase-like cupin family protein
MTDWTATGISIGAGEGERIRSPLGGDVRHLVRGEHSNGALAALEAVNGPGEGPPLHVHTREDETAYVLEGEFCWKLGDELSRSGPGSFVFIPRGVPHTWQVIGERDGRMLVTFFPAGMEGFFDRLSSMTEFDLEKFREAASAHGMEVVGPPLAVSDPRSGGRQGLVSPGPADASPAPSVASAAPR